ncbi:MAG: nicotinamide-nucleotide amidase [Gammaproteobacteria bacterium]|nr:MAG: nicotinamide-nucleotide amidase [Gammaproteobacteria bacterium]
MPFPAPSDISLYELARQVLDTLAERNELLATAESCTGGWIAKVLTDVPGSSAVFDRGFVTYSNAAKQELLDVPPGLIETHGAVSREVVEAMAFGAVRFSRAQMSCSVSGIAGPGGGSEDKPVGTVWFGWCLPDGQVLSERQQFSGDRDAVRRKAVLYALQGVLKGLALAGE